MGKIIDKYTLASDFLCFLVSTLTCLASASFVRVWSMDGVLLALPAILVAPGAVGAEEGRFVKII